MILLTVRPVKVWLFMVSGPVVQVASLFLLVSYQYLEVVDEIGNTETFLSAVVAAMSGLIISALVVIFVRQFQQR